MLGTKEDCKIVRFDFFFFKLEYTAYNYSNSVQNLPFDDY